MLASTEEGEGYERLTISMQSRVPLGPGKVHVVVLVRLYLKDVVIFMKICNFHFIHSLKTLVHNF